MPTLLSLDHTIKQYGLQPRKSLGQHFLLDERITADIARAANIRSGDHIIEIGPGPGGLTRALLESPAKSVTAIEMDHRAIDALKALQRTAPQRLHIIEGDALKQSLPELTPAPRKIVANLPYNVGTAMLIQWLKDIHESANSYTSMTLMFQKEVAQRITAQPESKAFGRLSVLAQWLCACEYIFELPPEAFYPPPKIHSAIVTLTPHPAPLYDISLNTLETVIATAFGQRRKMLRSALKGLAVPADMLLEKAEIDGTKRAEALSLEQLCHLAKTYEILSTKNSQE